MQQLAPWYEEPPEPKRCRRSKEQDRASWSSGAARGNRARWALKNLPPIDPDDPWSSNLTPTEE
jgi:hypothetical protein